MQHFEKKSVFILRLTRYIYVCDIRGVSEWFKFNMWLSELKAAYWWSCDTQLTHVVPQPQFAPAVPTGIFNFYLFIYLWLFWVFVSVRGLFSSCGKWGPLFIALRGPLTAAAPPAAEHRLQTRRLSSCGPRAQLLRGMRDPPRPGLEPVSPALAGRLATTAPPGKPPTGIFK